MLGEHLGGALWPLDVARKLLGLFRITRGIGEPLDNPVEDLSRSLSSEGRGPDLSRSDALGQKCYVAICESKRLAAAGRRADDLMREVRGGHESPPSSSSSSPGAYRLSRQIAE